VARFAFGGVSAPFVGIVGAAILLPLGIVTVVSVALTVAAYAALVLRRAAPDPAPSSATARPLAEHR
jgi:MFS transporter, DHA1 family, multidrug resistance protein